MTTTDTQDLINRLEAAYKASMPVGDLWNLCSEAADELERLRAQVAELNAFLRSRDANIVEQNKQLNQFRVLCADQAAAAHAVIARWDSPDWKDARHTGELIDALRKAITAAPPSTVGAESVAIAREAKEYALAIFGDGDVRSDLRELTERIDRLAALAIQPAAPAGWKLVPEMPDQAMWGDLARDIVWWLYGHSAPHYGSKLHRFLGSLGRDIPDWLAKEIPNVDHSPAKGTVAVCIYRAMLEAAPAAPIQQTDPICPACKGSGEGGSYHVPGTESDFVDGPCPECGGSGEVQLSNPSAQGTGLTDAQIDAAIEGLDTYARDVDIYEYGLPFYDERKPAMRAIVRAALAQAPAAVPQWQPIETAPKNGRKLILAYRNRADKARTVMARWLTDEEAAETDADGVGLEGGWYECIDNWGEYTEVTLNEGEPTHWMLPPAPPAADSSHQA